MVEELPFAEKNLLSEGPLEAQTSKVSVTSSKPSRHDTLVSTAPGEHLHYEKKVKIDSLDGFYQEQTKINGQKTLTWKPHSKPNQISQSEYVKLADRTKTMNDLRELDSSVNRESARIIRSLIEKEQIAIQIIDEFTE